MLRVNIRAVSEESIGFGNEYLCPRLQILWNTGNQKIAHYKYLLTEEMQHEWMAINEVVATVSKITILDPQVKQPFRIHV